MKYKEIYCERRNHPVHQGVRADQFFTLTLFECKEDYKAPMLLMVESGYIDDEDWERHWEIMDMNRNQAIREVIKRIDTHVFSSTTPK